MNKKLHQDIFHDMDKVLNTLWIRRSPFKLKPTQNKHNEFEMSIMQNLSNLLVSLVSNLLGTDYRVKANMLIISGFAKYLSPVRRK